MTIVDTVQAYSDLLTNDNDINDMIFWLYNLMW